jgi:hypothetical protein
MHDDRSLENIKILISSRNETLQCGNYMTHFALMIATAQSA